MHRRPAPEEYAPFHGAYVGIVPETDVLATLKVQVEELLTLLRSISEEESLVRHEPFTWSTREVVGHMTDAERVFGYRALCFSRGDTTPLPGFDENAYANAANFDRTSLSGLAREFEATRRSNIFLFEHCDEDAWALEGTANGARITVRALAYVIAGHARHHADILRQRHSR